MAGKEATNPTDYTLDQAEDHIGDLIGQVDLLGEAHTKDDSTDPPDAPATGTIGYASGGHEKYTSSDGNTYNTGRLTLAATGALALTTGLQTIPGLTAALAVGTWHIHSRLLITNPGTAGQGVFSFQITASGGLTASAGRFSVLEFGATGTVGTADFASLGSPVASGSAPGTGGLNRVADIEAIFDISVAGTFAIQIKQAATAACTVVQKGTFAEVFPIT